MEALAKRADMSAADRDAVKTELKDAEKERDRLIEAQSALLYHASSWKPRRITASERTQESKQSGFDLFFKAGVANIAEGQRPLKSWPY